MKIPIRRKEIVNANILLIEAGTNGPQGGDHGHGGRTYLKLSDGSGTSWKVRVKEQDGKEQEIESPSYIEILLGGDSELDTFLRGLKFAVETLEQMSN
jgi:hypothetical protein